MSDETTLLPCAHCGNERPWLEDIEHTQGLRWYVFCSVCGATGGQKRTRAEAIAAWNTRAVHGTLTAEQVRKAVFDGSTYASYDGAQYYASGISMQAIADVLNGMLGSGTCELDETESYSNSDEVIHVLECSACGRTCEHVNGSYPRCPHCGRKVEE